METWKQFEQNQISHSAAHHLMAIDDLVQTYGYARVSDIARQLGITRGSVSISLRPLKEAELILQDENKHLRLSPAGQKLVNGIKAKRLVIQRLLADVLGVAPQQAEIDACKIEHLVSHETARQIVAALRAFDSAENAAAGIQRVLRGAAAEEGCHQEPETCPSCENECIAANFAGQTPGAARE